MKPALCLRETLQAAEKSAAGVHLSENQIHSAQLVVLETKNGKPGCVHNSGLCCRRCREAKKVKVCDQSNYMIPKIGEPAEPLKGQPSAVPLKPDPFARRAEP